MGNWLDMMQDRKYAMILKKYVAPKIIPTMNYP